MLTWHHTNSTDGPQRNCRRPLSTIVFVIGLATGAVPAAALDEIYTCDDPAHILSPDSDIHLLHRMFNYSSASKRLLTEIHYYAGGDPDLTIGMGHFIRDKITRLFTRLKSNADEWQLMIDVWHSVLTENHWKQIHKETNTVGDDKTALASALDQVLCMSTPTNTCVKSVLEKWADKVGERFNSEKHWFTAGWKKVGRLDFVAKAQAIHWRAEVLEKGVLSAASRKITARGGVASVISAQSSGLGATMFGTGINVVTANSGGVSRKWSLVETPDGAIPDEINGLPEDRILRDWRAVVAWQYYTVKKRRVRSRMRAIWKTFYKPTWSALKTPITVSGATKVPKHTGCRMNEKSFDFTPVFVDGPWDCTKALPALKDQTKCESE